MQEIVPALSLSQTDAAVAGGHAPAQAEGDTTMSDFGWLLPDISDNLLAMLNPMNWIKTQQSSIATAVSEDAADTEAACQTLGVTPDFFSPVGSRLSRHSGSGSSSEPHSSGSDSSSASGSGSSSQSSRTSDFSDGTYASSADSGSGDSVPSSRGDYTATDRWVSGFKEEVGDSSDIVDDGSGNEYDDDW